MRYAIPNAPGFTVFKGLKGKRLKRLFFRKAEECPWPFEVFRGNKRFKVAAQQALKNRKPRGVWYTLAIIGLLWVSVGVAELSDPTRPSTYRGPVESWGDTELEGLVVDLILEGPDRRLAVVNGAIVSIGDTVAGWIVTDIKAGAVVFKNAQGLMTVPLVEATTVKQVAVPP